MELINNNNISKWWHFNKRDKEKRSANEITSLYKATFGTPTGQKCLEHLIDTFLNREVYTVGKSLDEVAFRQGQNNIVKQILKEVNSKGHNNERRSSTTK